MDGDFLKQDVTTVLNAIGGINEENSKLIIQSEDGGIPVEISIMDQSVWEGLKDYGIQISSENSSQVIIEFKREMALLLPALESGGSSTYTINIHLEDNNGLLEEQEQQVIVEAPVFELTTSEGDAFAKRIILRADMAKGSKEKLSFRYKETDASEWITYEGDIQSEDGNQYIGTLTGLNPTTSYQVQALYKGVNTWESKEVVVMTETPGVLPNVEFEGDWNSRSISDLMNGADLTKDRVTLTSNEPHGWASVNTKTFSGIKCFLGTVLSTYNSVPSAMKVLGYEDNGSAVRLRTLGWDNDAGNTVTICYHAAAGKLFLGSYAYNHDSNKDTYDYGISFTSRPSSVKANYKYEPCKGDSFKAIAVVLNREGGNETVIGSGEIVSGEAVNDWRELNFEINYTDLKKKATHIYVLFSSSANYSENEETETNNLKSYLDLGTEKDGYTHHEGSNLYIDNVELIYE